MNQIYIDHEDAL